MLCLCARESSVGGWRFVNDFVDGVSFRQNSEMHLYWALSFLPLLSMDQCSPSPFLFFVCASVSLAAWQTASPSKWCSLRMNEWINAQVLSYITELLFLSTMLTWKLSLQHNFMEYFWPVDKALNKWINSSDVLWKSDCATMQWTETEAGPLWSLFY